MTNHAMLGIAASGLARRAAGAPGARRRRGARADRPGDGAGDLRAVRRRRSSTPPGSRAGTAASRRPTSTRPARRWPPSSSSCPRPGSATGCPPAARDAVASVRDATRALLSVLKPETGGRSAPPEGGRKVAQATMLALLRGRRPDGRRPRGPPAHRPVVQPQRGPSGLRARPGCYAAPLAVNGLIRTHLLAGRSGVLTSATLELGGSFDPIARAVGLEVRPTPSRVGPTSLDRRRARAAVGGAVARARRRQPVRLPAAGDPLPRPAPAAAGPRAGDGRAARRDRGADHGGGRSHARAVLVAARGQRGGGRDARAARRPDPRAGRRPAADAGRRSSSPTRPPACSGRCRSGRASTCPGATCRLVHHRPHPVPAARRPGAAPRGPTRSRRPAATASWPCPRRTRRCCSRRAPAG